MNKRFDEVQVLRGLACLSVIWTHVACEFMHVSHRSALVLWLVMSNQFAKFGVPLFVLISGFVLSGKYRGNFSVRDFYTRRMNAVVAPYLVFSAICIALKGMVKGWPTLETAIFQIVTGKAYYHLHFFRIIITIYLAYPAVIRLYEFLNRRGWMPFTLVLAALFQVGAEIFMWNIRHSDSVVLEWLIFLPSAAAHIYFFLLGIFVRDRYSQVKDFLDGFCRKNAGYILAACLALVWAVTYPRYVGYLSVDSWYDTPLKYVLPYRFTEPLISTLTFVLCFFLIRHLRDRVWRVYGLVRVFGVYSFGVYLTHAVWVRVFIRLLAKVSIVPDDPIFYPVLFTITAAASLYTTMLINRTVFSRVMIGIDRKTAARGSKGVAETAGLRS